MSKTLSLALKSKASSLFLHFKLFNQHRMQTTGYVERRL